MKKMVLATALAGVMLLSGCSGVSQDEYNSLVEANSSLSSRNNVLTQKVSEQESANSSLSEANSQMFTEYEQLKKDAEPYLKLSEAERAAEMERLQKEEEERKAQEEAARQEEEAKGYETGITFDDISRSPDKYKGKKVKFSGSVLQVIEGYLSNNLRMSTSGNYDDVILVDYKTSLIDVRLLDNDKITIYGTFTDLQSYTAVMGNTVTVPMVKADRIELTPTAGRNPDGSIVSVADIESKIEITTVQTQNEEVCAFITNNSDAIVGRLKIQAIFKDAGGTMIDTDDGRVDLLSPGATVVVCLDTPNSFDSFDIEKTVSVDENSYYTSYYDKCSITGNEGEKCVMVQFTNNSDKEISYINYVVLLYNGDDVVDTSTEHLYNIAAGKTEVDKVNTYSTEYDRFEIYLQSAYGS